MPEIAMTCIPDLYKKFKLGLGTHLGLGKSSWPKLKDEMLFTLPIVLHVSRFSTKKFRAWSCYLYAQNFVTINNNFICCMCTKHWSELLELHHNIINNQQQVM